MLAVVGEYDVVLYLEYVCQVLFARDILYVVRGPAHRALPFEGMSLIGGRWVDQSTSANCIPLDRQWEGGPIVPSPGRCGQVYRGV